MESPVLTSANRTLRPAEVATILGIHKSTLESWWRSGKCPIPFTTLPSGHRRFRLDDVLAYQSSTTTSVQS